MPGKYGILGVHAEPYSLAEESPYVNAMWDRNKGRISIRYCTFPTVSQINDASIILGDVPQELLDELSKTLSKIVEHSLSEAQKSEVSKDRNANFINDPVRF